MSKPLTQLVKGDARTVVVFHSYSPGARAAFARVPWSVKLGDCIRYGKGARSPSWIPGVCPLAKLLCNRNKVSNPRNG